MKKIRVLHIVREPVGGIRKHILDIIDNIDNKAFESILITSCSRGDAQYKLNTKNNFREIDYKIDDNPGLRDFKVLFDLYKIIKNLDIDIVHGHGAKGGLYARIIGKILNKKVIYTAHGGSLHNMFGKVKSLVFQAVEKALYYCTDVLVFESKYSMNQYALKINKSKIKYKLNYNAINISMPEKVKSFVGGKVNIGSFGLLRKIKGHDLLIRACELLKKDGHDFQLKIFGNGEELNNLQNLIEEKSLADCIQILEYCEKIKEEMRKCDLIVHPSRFESFGYVPIEALNEGVSVVSSLEGGLREVMGDGEIGFCTKELNEINLYQCMKKAIDNPQIREEKYKLAKIKIKEDFNFDNFIRNIEEIYTKCLR